MLAQAGGGGGSGTDPILTFLQYGVLGLVVVALLFGWLWAKPAVQQLLEDKKRAEEQRDEAYRQWETRVLPLLSQFADAAEKQADAVRAVLQRVEDERRTR